MGSDDQRQRSYIPFVPETKTNHINFAQNRSKHIFLNFDYCFYESADLCKTL